VAGIGITSHNRRGRRREGARRNGTWDATPVQTAPNAPRVRHPHTGVGAGRSSHRLRYRPAASRRRCRATAAAATIFGRSRRAGAGQKAVADGRASWRNKTCRFSRKDGKNTIKQREQQGVTMRARLSADDAPPLRNERTSVLESKLSSVLEIARSGQFASGGRPFSGGLAYPVRLRDALLAVFDIPHDDGAEFLRTWTA